jgi:hypothetical protein
MAKNIKSGPVNSAGIKTLRGVPTFPAAVVSGSPCLMADDIPGTALTVENATTGEATVLIDLHTATHPVKGINAGGNVAVAKWDKLYYTSADTPPISKKATGVYFGRAMEAVVSGATTTIEILIGK